MNHYATAQWLRNELHKSQAEVTRLDREVERLTKLAQNIASAIGGTWDNDNLEAVEWLLEEAGFTVEGNEEES